MGDEGSRNVFELWTQKTEMDGKESHLAQLVLAAQGGSECVFQIISDDLQVQRLSWHCPWQGIYLHKNELLRLSEKFGLPGGQAEALKVLTCMLLSEHLHQK